MVRPILEYSSSFWDPPSSYLASQIESVQYFALKACSKSWSSSYDLLLKLFKLEKLSIHRNKARLFLLFKIIKDSCFIHNAPIRFQPKSHYLLCNYHHRNIIPIYCSCGAETFATSCILFLNH